MNPIIIIGAGRSGTNILRDLLCEIPGYITWPCDEINYIWRHGNITEPTDEFKAGHATPRVKKFIRSEFKKLKRNYGPGRIVEKTCANSLRVSFVNQIFPEAKFIHIIRDGRDVVNSARKRWTAELELDYILEKAKFIPLSDLPYYAFNYLGNRIYRLFSEEKRLASWGPRFKGMDNMATKYSLEEVCAIQWKRCVEKASTELAELPKKRVHTLHYEDFINNTKNKIKELLSFIGTENKSVELDELSSMVHSNSEGKWKTQLNEKQIKKINRIIDPTLQNLGYK